MVQTGAEPTADERADQLQYHDRLVMREPPARGLDFYLMGRSDLPGPPLPQTYPSYRSH